MKTLFAKLSVLPLLLALVVMPLCAQDADSTNSTAPTPPIASNAPAPDAENVVPTPQVHEGPEHPKMHIRNDHVEQLHRLPQSAEAPQVRIDDKGIFVSGLSGKELTAGPSFTAVLIALGAILIPFVFLTGIVAIIFEARRRKNQELHQTLRLMIEKGVAIPPDLIATPQRVQPFGNSSPRAKSDLRSGLVWIALGIGVLSWLASIHSHAWALGLVLILMGGAFLLTYRLEKKEAAKSQIEPK